MFILKKIFQLRDKTQRNDDEKPFLEHLEDLRDVIIKLALTLFVATLACFVFKNQLMEVIRRPIEKVWTNGQQAKMPKEAPVPIKLKTWELAKKAAYDTSTFTPEQKDYYFNHVDPDGIENLKFHSTTIGYYRAAIDIEELNQSGQGFIDSIPGITETMRSQLTALMDEQMRPDATVDAEGKVVRMQSLTPTEGFMLSMKLAFFAGIIISFPLILYFLMQFILPGLKPKEKKALWPAMAVGFGLFLVGVLFSYFFVLPKVLDFFYNYSNEMGVENEWRIGYYITFATQFTLIFGLGFELPVVVMTMVKLDILSYEMMRNTRSYAIIAIVVIAAIITPTPDIFTLGLLAGPMVFLYEICIWMAYFDNKKKAKITADEEEESIQRRLKAVSASSLAVSRDDDELDELDDHKEIEPLEEPDELASPLAQESSDLHNEGDSSSFSDEQDSFDQYDEDEEDDFDEDHYLDAESDHYQDGDDEGNEEDDGVYIFDEDEEDYDPVAHRAELESKLEINLKDRNQDLDQDHQISEIGEDTDDTADNSDGSKDH